MSTYAVQGETLGLIADAIRGKLGTDEPMEVSSMASMIESIPTGSQIGTTRVEFNCTYNNGEGIIYFDADGNLVVAMLDLVKLYTFEVSSVSPIVFFGTTSGGVTYIRDSAYIQAFSMSTALRDSVQAIVNRKLNRTKSLGVSAKLVVPSVLYPTGTTFSFSNYYEVKK